MSLVYRKDGGYESSGGAGGSTVAGSTQVTVTQLLDSSGGSVAAGDSANAAIRVNVVAGAAAGSTLVTVRQSTAGDLQATVTPVAGSTWRTQPGSTAWASSAGFHFDSSGALQVVATVTTSTTVNVSSLAGAVIVRSSAADHLATVYQSSAADLNVTVAGYVAPSTIVSVSTGSVRVHQSTATDLLARVNQGIGNSSAGDRWNVSAMPLSTVWASSAGFHFDSSGALQVAASFTGSTIVTVSRNTPPATVAYGQVVMGSTAAQIVGANANRARLIVINNSTLDIYLGASTVTSTSGAMLAGIRGNQMLFKHDDAVSGISTGGSPVVSFYEETF